MSKIAKSHVTPDFFRPLSTALLALVASCQCSQRTTATANSGLPSPPASARTELSAPAASASSGPRVRDVRTVFHTELVAFVERLHAAVRDDKHEEVAALVHFPLTVQSPGPAILDRQEFLARYGVVLTSCVKRSILALDAERIDWTRYGFESIDRVLMLGWLEPSGPWQIESIGNIWCDQAAREHAPR